jgi:iron complex transport system ATP-binding protein
MLKATNLNYRIGEKIILRDVSVKFEPSRLNLIIGPNGAGKSTLIKILSNQLSAGKEGSVTYNERPVQELTLSELARFRSVLSQNIDLAFPMNVKEVVMMGRYPHFTGKPEEKDFQAIQEAMQYFDLFNLRERDYLSLSGGEKQRVQFARVLSQIWYPLSGNYRYLILDEPLTFLDIHYQFDFMHKLVDLLKAGDLVVVGVVHDLNLAARFADNIVLMHQGSILASGDKRTVLSTENIGIAYQMHPQIQYHNEVMQLFFS